MKIIKREQITTADMVTTKNKIGNKTDAKSIYTFRDACLSVLVDKTNLQGMGADYPIIYLWDNEVITDKQYYKLEDKKLNPLLMSFVMLGTTLLIGVDDYGLSELFDDIDLRVNPADEGDVSIDQRTGQIILNEMLPPNKPKPPKKPNPFDNMM